MPVPATTIASSSSGFRKPPGVSVKPRHEYIATQVVPAAVAASRTWAARLPRARLMRDTCGMPRLDAAGGLGAGVPELLPDRVEPVARARAAAARQPCWASSWMAPGPGAAPIQASTSSATASAEPAWCCIRRSTGRSVGATAPKTATVRPPCEPSVSQPVSRRVCWAGLDDGQRLEQRTGVEVGAADVPGAGRVLAGRGDQAYGEAAVGQVHGDRGGRRDGGLQRRGDALAAVRGRRGCRGRASPGTARAAPRGAPSARRAWPSCASAPGAGRRPGGTRGR